jgi:hypothetical protein
MTKLKGKSIHLKIQTINFSRIKTLKHWIVQNQDNIEMNKKENKKENKKREKIQFRNRIEKRWYQNLLPWLILRFSFKEKINISAIRKVNKSKSEI